MRKEKKSEKSGYFLWQGIVIFFVLFVAFGIGRICLENIDNSQYEERVANCNVLMEKISHHVESAMLFNWNTLHYVRNEIEETPYASMKDVLEMLKRCEKNLQAAFGQSVVLIDSKGNCYTADEKIFKWQANSILKENEDRVFVSDYQIGEADNMKMFFVTKLAVPVTVDGTTFSHVSLVNDMRLFDDFFDVSSYGEESITFIIHENGAQIYRQEKETALSGIYNVLAVLEDGVFHHDTDIEKVKSDIQNGINDSVHVDYQGEPYFVSYYRLNINDWVTVLMVPEEYVGAGTKVFTHSIINNVGVIFAVVVLTVIALIVWLGFRRWKDQGLVREQLRQAAEAERAANEAKTRFLSAMSHDIRTPMNAIVGMTVLAQKQLDDPEYIRECLDKIKRASNHLLMLINDILDISKVESGKMTLNYATFSLADCAMNLMNIVRPKVKEKEMDFNIRVHGITHEYLYGDELRLNQVFINLLSNAIKFTDRGGRINVDFYEKPIEGEKEKAEIIYRVEDNGMGMSQNFQKEMYSSFARATDSRISKIQGSGLGLAICKQVVDLMGGTIVCESKEGEGTTFTVSVILDISEKEEEENLILPALRLLLVDDDEVFLETASDTISSFGLLVDCETTGEAALARAVEEQKKDNGYLIAIIDKQLPGMDGLETTRAIRKQLGEEIPIIVVSAYDTTEFEKEALEAGANTVISKPFFKSMLYEQLSRLLNIGDVSDEQKEEPERKLEEMKVLVAEDNDMNWEIIQAILNIHGIASERAENGKICVEMMNQAKEGTYEAILMDVRMPVLGGLQATRELRVSTREWVRDIPIIAMTADAFAEDIQACLEAGMDEHLSKPIDVDKLLYKLQKIRGGRKTILERKIVQIRKDNLGETDERT